MKAILNRPAVWDAKLATGIAVKEFQNFPVQMSDNPKDLKALPTAYRYVKSYAKGKLKRDRYAIIMVSDSSDIKAVEAFFDTLKPTKEQRVLNVCFLDERFTK